MFEEYKQVVLSADVRGDKGQQLRSGDVGVVIQIHAGEEAYAVEFMAPYGDTAAIATVLPSQACRVTNAELTHARTIDIAV